MDLIWKGKYSYDQDFDEESTFDFTLKVSYNDASFEGIALEEEFTGLTGEHATVKGFIDAEHISFVKKYPFKYEEQDDGSIIFDREQKGHEVVYDGYFNSELGIWAGDWEITYDEVKMSHGKYQESLIIGFWQMTRE